MTEQDLINAGYHEYKRTPFDSEFVEKNFQKCIRDKNGRKYFIDAHKYMDMKHPYTDETIVGGFEFTTQLTHKDYDKPVNMNFFCGWTIEEVEKTIELLWQQQFKYYEMDGD